MWDEKKLTLILICVRHGINPFWKNNKNIYTMKQKFTDEEKEFIIKNAKSKVDRYIWRLWLCENDIITPFLTKFSTDIKEEKSGKKRKKNKKRRRGKRK